MLPLAAGSEGALLVELWLDSKAELEAEFEEELEEECVDVLVADDVIAPV